MSQYHGDHAGGVSGTMMFILLLVATAVVAIAVLAWQPWNEDGDNILPGQGGEDGPRQEMMTPSAPQSTPGPQSTPTVPRLTPSVPMP
jgi:hypothetical protein